MTAWWEQAQCRGSELDFLSESVKVQTQCIAVCATCTVRVECLVEAKSNDEVGVWGGTTDKQRGWMLHGSYSTYRNRDCRCLPCREANARYMQDYRRRSA